MFPKIVSLNAAIQMLHKSGAIGQSSAIAALDAGLFFTTNFEVWVFDDAKDVPKRVCHRCHANATANIFHIAMSLRAKFKHPLV